MDLYTARSLITTIIAFELFNTLSYIFILLMIERE